MIYFSVCRFQMGLYLLLNILIWFFYDIRLNIFTIYFLKTWKMHIRLNHSCLTYEFKTINDFDHLSAWHTNDIKWETSFQKIIGIPQNDTYLRLTTNIKHWHDNHFCVLSIMDLWMEMITSYTGWHKMIDINP